MKNNKPAIILTIVLNANAVIGAAGNPNKVFLKYSNNPNSADDNEEGETPEDKVIVFTYKFITNKVDQNGDPLSGADFTLYKEVPAGTEGAQTGAAIKTALAAQNASIKAAALADAKSYIVVGNKTGDASGFTFEFKGIDDGNYVLVETTIPDGYNAWDAAAFKVSAAHDNPSDDPKLTELVGGDLFTGNAGTVNLQEGALNTNIVNKSGNTLPSTGGVGTTIFYVLGGILVIAAAVMLSTKKRMDAQA